MASERLPVASTHKHANTPTGSSQAGRLSDSRSFDDFASVYEPRIQDQAPNQLKFSNSNNILKNKLPIPSIDDLESYDLTVEKSYESILNEPMFDPILPRVFSFLSEVELMFVCCVNRRWNRLVAISCAKEINILHLGQFWSRLGVLSIQPFKQLVSRFDCVTQLNLSYCNKVDGSTLLELLQSIPHCTQIHTIDLFYCYMLTDEDIRALVQCLPNLLSLDVGRCNKLTNRAIEFVAVLPGLQRLSISSNPNINEEFTNLLDDPSKFLSLRHINLLNCSQIKLELVEEMKQARPGLRVVGPIARGIMINSRKQQRHREPDNNNQD